MQKEILLLGDLRLRGKCKAVVEFNDVGLKNEILDLKDTLDAFRRKNSFGRGIAAIQIGIPKRIIAVNFGTGTSIIINPVIISQSKEKFTLWDDCMSFPDLLVRVERYKTISVEYKDEFGNKKIWENLTQAESELLQHEIDHLDGILALDRKIGNEDIIYKSEFYKNKKYYESRVNYLIVPTL